MNRFLSICFGFILIANSSFSQYNLIILISDIRNNDGKIMLQMFDENQKIHTQIMGEIKDNKCIITINNLKSAKYAIRFFHDENLNGIMEKNLFGMPTEGYGFSNNLTPKFGPPPFKSWLFFLNDNKQLILKPIY